MGLHLKGMTFTQDFGLDLIMLPHLKSYKGWLFVILYHFKSILSFNDSRPMRYEFIELC